MPGDTIKVFLEKLEDNTNFVFNDTEDVAYALRGVLFSDPDQIVYDSAGAIGWIRDGVLVAVLQWIHIALIIRL